MAVFSKNIMFTDTVKSAGAAASTPVPAEKIETYFRFFNETDELFWSFVGIPTDNCLNRICRALKLPNYEEIDVFDFKRGYRH